METQRPASWLLGYLAATSLDFEMIAVIAIPHALDACERMDFVDGVLIGDLDRRNAEEMDELARLTSEPNAPLMRL